MQSISTKSIQELQEFSQKYEKLYYKGSLELLKRQKISIVGSRRPNSYAKSLTHEIALKLAKVGVVVVSGGAIGVDAIAHRAAGVQSTIMVAATGLEKRYPAINKNLIASMEQEGLVLSQFEPTTPSHKYNFVLRNELIVALGEALIVPYAEEGSGSKRSIEYAQKMGKKIYVLPHRLHESRATNKLLAEKKAEAIYDIDAFVAKFGKIKEQEDPFLEFCKTSPTIDEAVAKFGSRVFEAELLGEVRVENGRVAPL